MKTVKILIATCFLALTSQIKARPIVTVHKSGGIFCHYNNIRQIYLGMDNNGNRYYDLTCTGAGFERCKIVYAFTTGGGTISDEIALAETNGCNNAIEWVDNEIENKKVGTGSGTKHYQLTLSNNSTLDIYVKLTWAPIPGTSDYEIKADVTSNNSQS